MILISKQTIIMGRRVVDLGNPLVDGEGTLERRVMRKLPNTLEIIVIRHRVRTGCDNQPGLTLTALMKLAFSVLLKERHSLRTAGLTHFFAGAPSADGAAASARTARDEKSIVCRVGEEG